ncbi:MAG: NAD-dependent epimerase/dehydratase family protein [Calditrichaeota bacterium]|nr:NAD-dependent epimerase/dehydratase family protein [Calditrichota bacterium]
MSRMTLLTGGTGFVGSHLAEEMTRAGWRVRALVRRPEKPRWLRDMDVEITKGDVEEPSSLQPALKGVELVLHCAGLTKANRRSEYMKANAQGTQALVEASVRVGVRRFVYCSSQAAAGPATNARPRVEEDVPEPITDYGVSKLEGERAVRNCGGQIEWMILRPPAVFGPRDEQFLPLFRMIKKYRRYPSFGHEERAYSWIFVRDLVSALRLAAETETGLNETYFVADGTPVSWRKISEIAAALYGSRVRPLPGLSLPVLQVIALLSEGVARLQGKAALFNRQKFHEILAAGWVVSSQKIQQRLGFRCRIPLADAVRETAHWYEEQGWL